MQQQQQCTDLCLDSTARASLSCSPPVQVVLWHAPHATNTLDTPLVRRVQSLSFVFVFIYLGLSVINYHFIG